MSIKYLSYPEHFRERIDCLNIGLDEFIIHNLFISLTLIYVYEIVLSQYRYGKKNRHSKLILIQENVINNLEINCPVNPLEQCKRILKNSNNRPK